MGPIQDVIEPELMLQICINIKFYSIYNFEKYFQFAWEKNKSNRIKFYFKMAPFLEWKIEWNGYFNFNLK